MIADALEDWLRDVAERSQPGTLRFYRQRSRWIAAALGELTWEQLRPALVLRELDRANRWPDGRRKAPDTQRGNIIAWQQFQKWAVDTGRLAEPLLAQGLRKPQGRLREVLPTEADLRRLLARASPQFAAIYQALLLTGARPGELCGAQISDLNRSRRVIVCRRHKTAGKTRRPRWIPVSQACLAVIDAHLAGRRTGPLFVTPRGRRWTVARLSQTFRGLRKACQIDRRVVLYSTRHHLATRLCRAQGIAAAAGVLGHSGLQTIKRYVHHDPQELVSYVDALDAAAGGQEPPREA
jgi:integrase